MWQQIRDLNLTCSLVNGLVRFRPCKIFWMIRVAYLVALLVKNPPAMQETQGQFLDGEDPLAKEMATHSNVLAWRIPRTEELGGLQSLGSQSRIQLKRLSMHINMWAYIYSPWAWHLQSFLIHFFLSLLKKKENVWFYLKSLLWYVLI